MAIISEWDKLHFILTATLRTLDSKIKIYNKYLGGYQPFASLFQLSIFVALNPTKS